MDYALFQYQTSIIGACLGMVVAMITTTIIGRIKRVSRKERDNFSRR